MDYLIDLIIYPFSFAIVLNISVGPLFFLLIETAISKGIRCSLSLIMGIISADILYICLCYFGGKETIKNLESNWILFLIGGIIIFIYGIKLLTKKKITLSEIKIKKADFINLFAKGFIISIANIGILIFWMGVVTFSIKNFSQEYRILIFFSTLMFFYISLELIKVILAKKLRSKLSPKVINNINHLLAYIFMIFGVFIALKNLF